MEGELTDTNIMFIIFVDDEVSIGKMVKKMLGRMGYEVTVCNNPKKALDLLRENPGAYDLLMTDQTMPDMTGEKLVDEASQICDIPSIISTGNVSSISSPAKYSIMEKPYRRNSLAERRREMIAKNYKKS